jgi:hypothetical protein
LVGLGHVREGKQHDDRCAPKFGPIFLGRDQVVVKIGKNRVDEVMVFHFITSVGVLLWNRSVFHEIDIGLRCGLIEASE